MLEVGRTIPGLDSVSSASPSVASMTFANAGTLGVVAGKRDEVVALLTQRSAVLSDVGCLLYEVGVNDDEPDTVFVVELWTSADAHTASLVLPAVRESIAAARPLLSGEFGGFRFDVVGSPLRG
jgi:quinol monooxygenase YgiN